MKNTLENKAKFFAQYYGAATVQYCFRDGVWEEEIIGSEYYPIIEVIEEHSDSIIELNPLSSISDEDAVELRKLQFINDKGDINTIKEFVFDGHNGSKLRPILSYTTKWKDDFWKDDISYILLKPIKLKGYMVDYLRSKGYALDWNGITVEQQIEFGWIKLNKK